MENLKNNQNTVDLRHSQGVQQGDNNIQMNTFKGVQQGDNNVQTNIFYGDDPEEEKLNSTLNTISPYLGLAPFTASNAKVFYGRKKLISTLSKELEKGEHPR